MSYQVEIQNSKEYEIDAKQLINAANTVLTQQNTPDGSAMTMVVEDNSFITTMNIRYRGIDAPTDVLSFPADAPPINEPDAPPYLGDIIIGFDYAQSQAREIGYDFNDSLILLVVHGTLHLLGFEHDTDENKAAMWEAQAQALQALGVSLEIVPALETEDDAEPEA